MAVLGPTNLVVTVISSTIIDMLWENRLSYGAIEVWENRAAAGYVLIDTIPGSKEYYKSDNLDPNIAYCYKVRGIFYPEGQTAFCTEDCDTTFGDIQDPTDIVATPISNIEIEVIFKDNSGHEASHRLEREISTDPDVWRFIVNLEPNREFFRDGGLFLLESGYTDCVETDIGKQVQDDTVEIGLLVAYDNTRRRWLIDSGNTIVDASAMTITGGTGAGTAARETKGLVKGSSYTYRVRAEENGTPSDYVESAQVTTISEPAQVTLAAILAADTKDKSIRIRWTDVANETGYRIEMSKTGDLPFDADEGDLIAVVGPDITDFLATGLDVGTAYSFRIRAYNAAGNGTFSVTRAATTDTAYEPTEFEKWIRSPHIEPVYLAELYTKMTLTGFTLESGVVWKKTIGASDRGIDILEVFEDGDAYVEKTSIATVQETAETFWFDYDNRILYIHTTGGADPAGFLIEGAFWLYFSTHKDIEFTVNGRLNHYPNYLSTEDIPDITQEIKPYFEGSFSISSGSIAFKNSSGFFDKKFGTYTWINAKVILKAGKDIFSYAQFKEIFTAHISAKACSDKKITFQLRDIREDMKNKIALNKFTTTDYPGIESKFVDKPIPIYFGTNELVTPACIDEEDEKFKCNDGRIKSIDRVFKNGVELVEDTHFFADLQRAIITFNRDGKFIIETGVNDKIDFQEAGGELNATLDAGTYTTAQLLTEIKSELESVGGLTYTVTCPSTTKKFLIAATGEFSLLWRTGTNGSEGTDTHVGTTIGFDDGEDDTDDDSHEASIDVISIHRDDIIGVQLQGIVDSADDVIDNGAEIFKYLMNNYKSLADSELNLDSIYEAKYASGALDKELSLPLDKEPSFDEIVRSIEHSIESYTFQDEFGRLGIRPQQAVVASNVKYVISSHIFGHTQKKDKSSLFWKVTIFYNKDHEDNYKETTATENEIKWKYGVEEVLDIYTYFSTPVHADALAASILSLLNKEQIESGLPMLLFDVMAGDLIKFSRDRFYNADGTVAEDSAITLRILKISKSPASGRTSIKAEVV